MGHVAVGVVSRAHGTSRRLSRCVCVCVCACLEWLAVLGPLEICSFVSVKGCVDDAKEKAAAE
jgi:hypothetical protein